MRKFSQLVIHQRQQFIRRAGLAAAGGLCESGYVVGLHHSAIVPAGRDRGKFARAIA
jgi:hypothetical protein